MTAQEYYKRDDGYVICRPCMSELRHYEPERDDLAQSVLTHTSDEEAVICDCCCLPVPHTHEELRHDK